jgi:regulator of replication initiation timing
MAMTKDEFVSVLQNKTLKELNDWCYSLYEKYQNKLEEVERLKRQKASETVKETNKQLREENNKLKAKLNKISSLTGGENVVVAEAANAD